EIFGDGGQIRRHVDVQLLVTTSKSLEELVRTGMLLEGLAARLGGVTLDVPPLRERREDIAALVRVALAREGAPAGAWIDERLALALLRHRWPGNVRELFALVRRALLSAEDRSRLTLTPSLFE